MIEYMNSRELVRWLEGENTGAKIVFLVYHSAPDCLKKHRLTKEPSPYGQGLLKVQGLSFTLGANYGNGVNRAMDAAGTDSTTIVPMVRVNFVDWFDRNSGRRIEDAELDQLKHYLPIDKPYTATREAGERFEPGQLWKGAGQHAGPYTVQHGGTKRLYWFGRPAGQGFSWSTYAVDQTAEITWDGRRVSNLECKRFLQTTQAA